MRTPCAITRALDSTAVPATPGTLAMESCALTPMAVLVIHASRVLTALTFQLLVMGLSVTTAQREWLTSGSQETRRASSATTLTAMVLRVGHTATASMRGLVSTNATVMTVISSVTAAPTLAPAMRSIRAKLARMTVTPMHCATTKVQTNTDASARQATRGTVWQETAPTRMGVLSCHARQWRSV